MTTLQREDDCQTNETNNSFPIESLRFPLDNTVRIVFTGYFNGFSVEVRTPDEVTLLYHMGCFGKGSGSRSKPRGSQNDDCPNIMRKRQFLKRNYWYKKFGGAKPNLEADKFLSEIDELTAKIISDSEKQSRKDVIDLVSSDEEMSETETIEHLNSLSQIQTLNDDKDNLVIIVPNSDSEEDNYFADLKPNCCINKINVQEKLMLTLQESFFLLYGIGCLQIVSLDRKLLNIEQCWDLFTKTDKNFIKKYVVYHYFRSKGYVVKPGIKFGGDYLLYREGPAITHADYIVVIRCNQDSDDWVSILGHVRMATTTVKDIIIAEVITPKEEVEKMPEGLSYYSVREIQLSRKIPVKINNDDE